MRVLRVLTVILLTCELSTPLISVTNNRLVEDKVTHAFRGVISVEDRLAGRLELAQAYSNRCFTPYFWCYLPQYAPINAPCWCATPNGPVNGVVR